MSGATDPAVDGGVQGGPDTSPEDFREALSRWASGVTVVAVREPDGTLHATTATSFMSVSAEPPRILVSLGPGAQVLPFLGEGQSFTVNVLAAGQRRIATAFADPYPVGPSPFGPSGDPIITGAHATLVCTVERLIPVGPVRLVLARVQGAEVGDGAEPLVRHQREYRSLTE